MKRSTLALALSMGVLMSAACSSPTESAPASASVTASPLPPGPDPTKPHDPIAAPERSGGALMRSADGGRLYVADEDHKSVRVLSRALVDNLAAAGPPVDAAEAPPSASDAPSGHGSANARPSAKPAPPPPKPGTIPPVVPPPSIASEEVTMPGAPAEVLPLDGHVLVTVRDPGMLVVMKEEAADKLSEERRIPLPADAWGVAVTKDEKVAVVTSAWTHQVSGIDWQSGKVLWTVDVGREPRAVVVHPDGKTAYVSHVTSANLTRIDDLSGSAPKVSTIAFPAAPARTPQAMPVDGALGYGLVLDDDGHRLLAARHALGGLAADAWYGIATIDVLQTSNDTPLLAPRAPDYRVKSTPAFDLSRQFNLNLTKDDPDDYRARMYTGPSLPIPRIVQPRAMIVSHKAKTVWVASEGQDLVAEFPLYSAAPAERELRSIQVGDKYKDPRILGEGIAGHCGAPTGLALNADETQLYVFCRSTYDIATVRIEGKQAHVSIARLANDPLDEVGSRGRRLFYSARDSFSSGGMGCAGCHPDGRDDGHVWHEVLLPRNGKRRTFLATKNLAAKTNEGKLGWARQTPMLAGRVDATGPYGWHAEAPTLRERLAEGFALHRWWADDVDSKGWMVGERFNGLSEFMKHGLATPPPIGRELTAVEKRGKEVFESEGTQCAQCHVPATGFTNRAAPPLPQLPLAATFEEDPDDKFKTPSLLFVGGTPPYYHDGSIQTLPQLIERNHDRMGKTSQLSTDDKAALAAYLETL